MARTVDPVKHAERRGTILDAATRQIAARGYEAVTISDVLAEARVSKGALYHYFSGKDELLVGVIERRIDAWGAGIDSAISGVGDPLDRLIALVRALTAAKTEDLTLLVSAMPQLDAGGNAAVYVQLRQAAAARFLPLITGIVEDGVHAGAFRVESAASAAKVVLSLLHEMSACATRDLLALAKGEAARDDVRADMRAYADAIPAVLGTSIATAALFREDEIEEWIDAVVERFAEAG